jgi:alpha-L-rhamnosidase
MARVGWSDAGIIVPWVILKQFGDTSLIKQHWTSMERYINHGAEVNFDHTALFPDNGGYQWADWLSYEALESFTGQPWDANGLRPEAAEYWSYLYGSYWIINAEKMIDMARLTNNDTTKYINMLAQAKEYVTNRFLTPDGEFKLPILNTMQTPALFALRNKLLERFKLAKNRDQYQEAFELTLLECLNSLVLALIRLNDQINTRTVLTRNACLTKILHK